MLVTAVCSASPDGHCAVIATDSPREETAAPRRMTMDEKIDRLLSAVEDLSGRLLSLERKIFSIGEQTSELSFSVRVLSEKVDYIKETTRALPEEEVKLEFGE